MSTTTSRIIATLLIAFVSLLATAQQPATSAPAARWTVKPEWVHADEEFLASDALEGRGSATRNEEIAATFVASKFQSFGLRPAAPGNSFIETVNLVTPKLDGKAQLAAGDLRLSEPADFHLLASSGESASGKLQKLAADMAGKTAVAPGSAVLLTGLPEDARALFQVIQRLRGTPLILVEESPSVQRIFGMLGGKTRVPMRVEGVESEEARQPTTVAVLTPDAFAKISQAADGTTVDLAVHTVATPPAHTYNAIAVLPGSDPAAGAVLLSAHLDHLGMRPDGSGDEIYNGADDDASGTTAVIELARALAAGPQPKRSVYFVCFGSEETGGQGDNYFRAHPPIPLDQFVANIEFEMIGAQDPKLPKGFLLLTGWERTDLGPALREHGAHVAPDPYPEQHYFQRSDNYALALKGVVAQTAGGWGDPPWYHRPNDDLAHLNWDFLTNTIQSFVAPVRWLINSDFKPQWKPGRMPKR